MFAFFLRQSLLLMLIGCLGITGAVAYGITQTNNTLAIVSRVDRQNSDIYLIDVRTNTLFNLTQHPATDNTPRWSPDGRWLAFVTLRNNMSEIMVYDMQNHVFTTVATSNDPHSPTWSSDSQQIAFVERGQDSEIYRVQLQDNDTWSEPTNVSRYPIASDISPHWSTAPDDSRLVYTSIRSGNVELILADTTTRQSRNISNHSADDYEPIWSPNGQYIAFQSTRDDGIETYIADLETVELRNVGLEGADDYALYWSPNSAQAVFESTSNNQADIYILDLATWQRTNISQHPEHDKAPQWSPNGERILFESARGTNNDILMWQDNTIYELGATDGYDYSAIWSPDSERIAFLSRSRQGLRLYVSQMNHSPRWLAWTHTQVDEMHWRPVPR